MMGERQAAFRAEYRQRISPWYHGWVHVVLVYAIGIGTVVAAARGIDRPAAAEWLVVPVVFLACNLFEWWLHRFIMHRPVAGFLGIYRRHTLAHHQFFTAAEPRLDGQRDFRITFFPPYALVVFVALSAAAAAVLDVVWSANAARLLVCTTTAVYLNYELFHYCCHLRDDRLVRHIPFVNTIRRHHIAHHDPAAMMARNMNLTYPITDWLLGTSDLDRGLLGHLFNGYDTRRVRRDVHPVRLGSGDPLTTRLDG